MRGLIRFVTLAAVAYIGLPPGCAHATEWFPPPATCPPEDRSDWRIDPTRSRADRIQWIVLPPAALYEVCESWKENSSVSACAFTRPDYERGGNTGTVFTIAPRYALSESFVQHEECHTQGYRHGPLYF